MTYNEWTPLSAGNLADMPFVYLLLFALLILQPKWPEPPPWLDPVTAALLPWALAVGAWLAATRRAHRFARRLALHPHEHGGLWVVFCRHRRRHFLLVTTGFVLLLYFFGWGFVARSGAGYLAVFPGPELVQYAPLLLALLLSWHGFYFAEKVSSDLVHDDEPYLGRSAYVALQARHNLLLVVPPIVLYLLAQAIHGLLPGLEKDSVFLVPLGVGLLVVALVSIPLILKFYLNLRPLPAGPLRDRLRDAAGRLQFRFSDVLVWDTRQTVANALVSGVLPGLRYVVLTDLLIERLTPEEVEAVFAHEVGHIKHHHMPLYVSFCLCSIVFLFGVWRIVEREMGGETATALLASATPPPDVLEALAGPGLLLLVSGYFFVVFGLLSRRCESEADLFGCRKVSSEAFIQALEKVADINGIPRRRTHWLVSWQHPPIAERVAFIERLRDDPGLERHFQRSLRVLKWGLMLLVGAGLALVTSALGTELFYEVLKVR
jgi:Zn-dependent protease with chaperone function